MQTSEYIDFFDVLNALPKARVLCIGDIMLDRYVYGAAERLSPEAPIPVLRKSREKEVPGGVGNVVANLADLGAKVSVLSVIGDDEAGRSLCRLVQARTGSSAGLVVDPARPTTVKTRFVAGQQQLLRVDDEETRAVSGDTARDIGQRLAAAVDECDVVVLSDYAKGVLSRETVAHAIALAASAGKPVIVDPKIRDFSFYRGASVITPNRKELEEAAGLRAATDDEVRAAALKLIDACGVRAVLATRSQDGMSVITATDDPVHIRAEAREVFDVSGAGDTVVAVLAAAMAVGASLADAAQLANAAAGIVVGKPGTATVTVDEIRAALTRQPSGGAMALPRALELAEKWRAKGLKVGFTNGCFDLLHPGHVSLLRQARAQCDRLVVGLNSDASVRRLKGASRPVHDEIARATVLSALDMVDAVVVFDEDTPIDLIRALRPDVLVKGADYTLDRVVGADVVMSYGGRVYLAALEDGFSTTATVRKISG